MRRLLSLCLVLGGVATAVVLAGAVPSTAGQGVADPSSEELFRFEGDESGVWPYVSTKPGVTRHGPMNLVVRADTDQVVWALTTTPDAAGEQPPPNTNYSLAPTPTEWKQTTGAARYVYVYDGQSGSWIRETAHVMDGTFYGARHHARLYESPAESEQWTAIQAHSEHFDWFTLGHVVENVEYAQARLERGLTTGQPSTAVTQVDLGNEDADGDGWASIITVSMFLLPIGLALFPTRDRAREQPTVQAPTPLTDRLTWPVVGLAATICLLVLGVRAAGLGLEAVGVPVAAIGVALYPCIGIGIPLSTALFARRIDRATDAAATAMGALATAMVADYAVVGVTAVPLHLVAYKIGLVFGLGVVAGGATVSARRDGRFDRTLAVGASLWVLLSVVGLLL